MRGGSGSAKVFGPEGHNPQCLRKLGSEAENTQIRLLSSSITTIVFWIDRGKCLNGNPLTNSKTRYNNGCVKRLQYHMIHSPTPGPCSIIIGYHSRFTMIIAGLRYLTPLFNLYDFAELMEFSPERCFVHTATFLVWF